MNNSRHQKRTNTVWRRRQCQECGAVFTTTESADLFKGMLVKREKRFEPFSRDVLFVSVHDSLRHRKTATADATGLTATIISKLAPLNSSGSLETTDITRITLEVLKRFDRAAAVHYQAYYLD